MSIAFIQFLLIIVTLLCFYNCFFFKMHVYLIYMLIIFIIIILIKDYNLVDFYHIFKYRERYI